MSWSDIVGDVGQNQYRDRIQLLNSSGITTTEIEHTVEGAIRNLKKGAKSFVIFGEPQSGKTEMMIALNAKLLDEGYVKALQNTIDILSDSRLQQILWVRFYSACRKPCFSAHREDRSRSAGCIPSGKIHSAIHKVFQKQKGAMGLQLSA